MRPEERTPGSVRLLQESGLLAAIRFGPDERRRFLWLELARWHSNFRWFGLLGLGTMSWTLGSSLLSEMGIIRFSQGMTQGRLLLNVVIGGTGIWGFFVAILMIRPLNESAVGVYRAGALIGGNPQRWVALKKVVFDRASSELRFYDYSGDLSTRSGDVFRLPIPQGKVMDARRVVEVFAFLE